MSPKTRTLYVCGKCDSQFPRWQGRCPECGSWGTLSEQTIFKTKEKAPAAAVGEVIDFEKISGENFKRTSTEILEFDRVLGGGIIPGSLILIGGEPGIGKSTLIMQAAGSLAKKFPVILYVSGEESKEQIKMRLDRLKLPPKAFKFLGETQVEVIKATIDQLNPNLVIIDSIQTMRVEGVESEPGSVSQIRAATVKFVEVSKENKVPIFLVGHITKGGEMAGPKTLEHLVDVVLSFEGDRFQALRILRASKNRFGSAEEIGVFEMTEKGLFQVKNPSALLLKDRLPSSPGSSVTCILEGKRPLLVEIQALTSRTRFGYPKRRASGFNFSRLELLISVLQKRCGLYLSSSDIQVNVVGGLKIDEPAADLAVSLAITSAFKNKALEASLVALGEVGLGGELRGVKNLDQRIKEIAKLGFKKVILPEVNLKEKPSIETISFRTLDEVIRVFLK